MINIRKGISSVAAVVIAVIIVVFVIVLAFMLMPLLTAFTAPKAPEVVQCRLNSDCSSYSYCIQGACVKPTQQEIQQNVGTSCDRNAECGTGLYCSKNTVGWGECRRYGDVGDSCGADTSCMQGLTCQGGFLGVGSTCQEKIITTTIPANCPTGTTYISGNCITPQVLEERPYCSTLGKVPFIGSVFCGLGLQGISG